MNTLYILCGPAGCGKSTWAHKFCKENPEVHYVSRDEVRFAIVKEDEDYFSHEKEVFKEFVKRIATFLRVKDSKVIADATHLNEFSRRKLIQALDRYNLNFQIICVVFKIDVETCIAQNAMRTGRQCVPENIVKNMCRDFRAPDMEEDERIIEVIEVE